MPVHYYLFHTNIILRSFPTNFANINYYFFNFRTTGRYWTKIFENLHKSQPNWNLNKRFFNFLIIRLSTVSVFIIIHFQNWISRRFLSFENQQKYNEPNLIKNLFHWLHEYLLTVLSFLLQKINILHTFTSIHHDFN